MSLKNTVEIITKDIQELEKIVRNFQNYPRVPAIEMDLALDKTRNLYELLLIIRDNQPDDLQTETESHQNPGNETNPQQDYSQKESAYPVNSEDLKESIEFMDEREKKNDPPARKEKLSGNFEKPVENKNEKSEASLKEKILAEKFQKHGDFINEKIGNGTKRKDLSSKIQSTPIKSISGSMGINDKFYFIRELFNGNAENFSIAMRKLDDASNYNEAYSYLLNTFEWDMESKTVQQLLNLIRRKFIANANE